MKTLSGKPGEKTEHMEYWYCPKCGRIKRTDYEIVHYENDLLMFHRVCGAKLKSLTYTRTSIFATKSQLSLVTLVQEKLGRPPKHPGRRPLHGWMEPDSLDEVLRR